MTETTVDISQIGATLRAEQRGHIETINSALFEAALRGMPKVVEATPVDRGHARSAWEVRQVEGGADLFNDMAHIGILEKGRRAGTRPPLMPILRWLVRKAGIDLNGGRRSFESIKDVPYTTYLAAKSICDKIEREGSPPVGMVANNLNYLRRITRQVTERRLAATQPFNPDDIPF